MIFFDKMFYILQFEVYNYMSYMSRVRGLCSDLSG